MEPGNGSGTAAAAGTEGMVSVVLREGGYAVLSMHKEPVNSLDLAMWRALEKALDVLEGDQAVRGLVITTGLKRDVFTAGNDLLELHAPRTSAARYREFWVTSNRFLKKLHTSRLATIAAIRGACPAGGCMMAMCCDHRVMSSAGTMGLNEVQLGIPVPKYWGLLMAKLIGTKAADKLLLTGKLVSPGEAKALGLVDQVVDKAELLGAAEKVMHQLVKLPPSAVRATKVSLRGDFAAEWAAYYEVEPEGAWAFLNQPDTLRVLEGALQRLSGKKAQQQQGPPGAPPSSKL
uniref:Uncharacterized protein n=1 Tax=Chlamydomonas leiostraca TaxID=1034604 RepID=A0A7S0WQJ1_9CHLO|mmetsp:Transcript_23394/g.59895  ORF Transcript_23394/g.59895 Transcript_23394/m.59895 type:complete len:290 (+) Transcript_23394:214-1083(+)